MKKILHNYLDWTYETFGETLGMAVASSTMTFVLLSPLAFIPVKDHYSIWIVTSIGNFVGMLLGAAVAKLILK